MPSDRVANTSGTNTTWVYYRGTGTVSCTLRSSTGTGQALQTQTGTRNGTGWFSIAPITQDQFWGAYSMFCRVPSEGTIHTVAVAEKT